MTNLTTSESNNLGEGRLEDAVETQESHIATALLGHFREYYNLDQNMKNITEKKVFKVHQFYNTEIDNATF